MKTGFNPRDGLREIAWGDMEWINLAEDSNRWIALMNTVMKLRVP
jgi:hypothetical protein